jgi:hypothetical protein
LAAHKPSASGAEIGSAMTKNQTMSPKAATNKNNSNKKKIKKKRSKYIYIYIYNIYINKYKEKIL